MSWFWIIYTYVIMEALINLAFHFITEWLKDSNTAGQHRKREIFKGILERLFLIVGILSGYPQVIIAFGALKIGTRFQAENKVSNDYFLIGNFISLLTAILYVIIFNNFMLN